LGEFIIISRDNGAVFGPNNPDGYKNEVFRYGISSDQNPLRPLIGAEIQQVTGEQEFTFSLLNKDGSLSQFSLDDLETLLGQTACNLLRDNSTQGGGLVQIVDVDKARGQNGHVRGEVPEVQSLAQIVGSAIAGFKDVGIGLRVG